jgi:NTP pyrophosphatase (non-canonical NTP hydrolase)
MKKITVLLLILSILCPFNIQDAISEEMPDSDEINKEVFNNVTDEYATCTAYFSIVSEGLNRSNEFDSAKDYQKVMETSLSYAFVSAQEGRTTEMTGKVVSAKVELNMKSMTEEIGNDIGNISILMNKYGDRCKDIMEDPEKLMKEWTDKILKKYGLN